MTIKYHQQLVTTAYINSKLTTATAMMLQMIKKKKKATKYLSVKRHLKKESIAKHYKKTQEKPQPKTNKAT